MIAGLFGALGGVLGFARILAVAVPLLYVFYTINDYRSQAVTISEQKTQISNLKKQVDTWESRYSRINDKRGEYKLLLDKYDEATKNAGCYTKVQQQLKLLIDTKWKTDALSGSNGGG